MSLIHLFVIFIPLSFAGAAEVSEASLVRDILYVFQGIDGKFIKMSAQDNCYKIDSKVPQCNEPCAAINGLNYFGRRLSQSGTFFTVQFLSVLNA